MAQIRKFNIYEIPSDKETPRMFDEAYEPKIKSQPRAPPVDYIKPFGPEPLWSVGRSFFKTKEFNTEVDKVAELP